MDASTYTPEATQRAAEDNCETETTRVFRKVPQQAQRRLNLVAQAAGNTARALKATR